MVIENIFSLIKNHVPVIMIMPWTCSPFLLVWWDNCSHPPKWILHQRLVCYKASAIITWTIHQFQACFTVLEADISPAGPEATQLRSWVSSLNPFSCCTNTTTTTGSNALYFHLDQKEKSISKLLMSWDGPVSMSPGGGQTITRSSALCLCRSQAFLNTKSRRWQTVTANFEWLWQVTDATGVKQPFPVFKMPPRKERRIWF